MSEALSDVEAANRRKQARRHAAQVSTLKKSKPVARNKSFIGFENAKPSSWKGVRVGVFLLGLCVLFGVQSAYQSQRMRALYSQMQQDQVARDALLAQHSRLLIERGAMNSYNGTEKLAKDELNMRFPETIVRVIKPDPVDSIAVSGSQR